jgi:hypothetical protein
MLFDCSFIEYWLKVELTLTEASLHSCSTRWAECHKNFSLCLGRLLGCRDPEFSQGILGPSLVMMSLGIGSLLSVVVPLIGAQVALENDFPYYWRWSVNDLIFLWALPDLNADVGSQSSQKLSFDLTCSNCSSNASNFMFYLLTQMSH